MATTFYLKQGGTLDLTPPGNLSADYDKPLSLTRGVGPDLLTTSTVAGPTAGVQAQAGATGLSWWSNPLNAVTISGTITKNFWMSENNMSANVGAQVIIDRCDGSGTFISTIQNSEKGTELVLTTSTAENWTTGTVTSTTLADGDRLRVRVYGNDVGTMGSGFTFGLTVGATSSGVDGDSFVTFTETITEQVASTFVPYTTPYPSLLAQ